MVFMIYILINVYPKIKHLVTTCFHFKQDYPISQIVIEQKRKVIQNLSKQIISISNVEIQFIENYWIIKDTNWKLSAL